MSALGTVEEVAIGLSTIAADVSDFAPPEVKAIAEGVSYGAAAIAAVLKALDGGTPADAIVVAIEQAMKASSDAQMKSELKP